MPEKFYHTVLKKEIEAIAKSSGRYKRIKIEAKIPIPHPNQELLFHYKPEAVLTTKLGKKYIFEVLDDQLKDHNLIIADIIQSFLIENVAGVIFISKNDDGLMLTKKLSGVMGAILEEKGFFKNEIPEVFCYVVSYDEARSEKLVGILNTFAKKDGWG